MSYRLVRDGEQGMVVAQGQPEAGFLTATAAAEWANAHDLDWRWYIREMQGDVA
jgi:hypothetical protein